MRLYVCELLQTHAAAGCTSVSLSEGQEEEERGTATRRAVKAGSNIDVAKRPAA